MVAEAIDIVRETYFCILLDREHNGPVIVCSPDGGMDIEEVGAISQILLSSRFSGREKLAIQLFQKKPLHKIFG